MIRVSEVSVVNHPNVSVIEDLVIRAHKELGKVLTWLKEI